MALSAEDADLIVADQDAAFGRAVPVEGTAVVDGAGCQVTVRYGQLCVSDGLGETRRERRFPRAGPLGERLSRLVVLSKHGYVSLDALAWCWEAGVEMVAIDDREGEPMWATSPGGPRDGRLTRLLALAGASDDHPLGLAIASYLLGEKLRGQAKVLRERLDAPGAAATIEDVAGVLGDARSITELRQLEATSAALYFDAWSGHTATVPRFAKKDLARVPGTWLSFDGRRSNIGAGRSNRRATHPVNAVLNYLHVLVKHRATMVANELGLAPELAVLHSDMARRDSLACDLQEPVRPIVEDYVLALLAARTFTRADFLEGPDGEVRLGMGLRQELAATSKHWTAHVAVPAEHVRGMLAKVVAEEGTSRSIALGVAPISGRRRRKAQVEVKARKTAMGALRRAERAKRPTLWTCPDCGGDVTDPRRVRCDACIAADPHQAPALRKSRAKAISARKQAEAGWSRKHHPGIAINRRWAIEELRPALAQVRLATIVQATGVAKSTASGWRAGHTVPHPMHWETLAAVAGIRLPEVTTAEALETMAR